MQGKGIRCKHAIEFFHLSFFHLSKNSGDLSSETERDSKYVHIVLICCCSEISKNEGSCVSKNLASFRQKNFVKGVKRMITFQLIFSSV
jgi:hypothetical protein